MVDYWVACLVVASVVPMEDWMVGVLEPSKAASTVECLVASTDVQWE